MDSGFSSLNGLTAMAARGVFGSIVLKKKRYWPKHVKGTEIESHMAGKQIGETHCLKGIMNKMVFHIHRQVVSAWFCVCAPRVRYRSELAC